MRARGARASPIFWAPVYYFSGRPPFLRLPGHHASGFSFLVTTLVATWLATVLLEGVGNLTVSLLFNRETLLPSYLITGPLFQQA